MIQEDGTKEKIKLSEKKVTLKNNDKQNPQEVACTEIRKLSKSGHQTSILTTNWMLSIVAIGFYMFARWCQENFFLYMKQNFDIDGLVSYSKEVISDTKMLVNPACRQLESELRSLNGKLSKQKTLFVNIALKEDTEKGGKLARSIAKKAAIHQEIKGLEAQIITIKEKKAKTDRKITFASLPQTKKFSNAINGRKQFMDNIKMIAYRAETGMYNMIKNQLSHPDEGRKLLQMIYTSDADIIADYPNKTLTVKLHNLNYRKDDKVAQYLCEKLNETEVEFPETDLKIIYQLVSS